MSKWYYEFTIRCHWCGKLFESKKRRLQARFCCPACKQAHHRAYKKYVTQKHHDTAILQFPAVTPKKRKKRK